MITLMLVYHYWKYHQFKWLFHDTLRWHLPSKITFESGCRCSTCKICKREIYDPLFRGDWKIKEELNERHKI